MIPVRPFRDLIQMDHAPSLHELNELFNALLATRYMAGEYADPLRDSVIDIAF